MSITIDESFKAIRAAYFSIDDTVANERNLDEKLADFASPEDFQAVGDGATDDLTPLTNFINYLLSNPSTVGVMGNKTYAVSSALPNINISGLTIIGQRSASHDVGSFSGTVIKKIGAASGTILTIAPTEGASAQKLTGVKISGIAFDCNSLADKGVVVKSLYNSTLDICVFNSNTTGLELGVATTLGEARDSQYNRIRYFGRQVEADGVSLRLLGDSTANVSLNTFEYVDITHNDSTALISENADNNLWINTRIYRAGGGAATTSIEWRGGATSAESTRNERFIILSTTVAAVAKGTGTYTVGAQDIYIMRLDKGNATPTPTEETGTTIYDGEWRTYTPTIAAGAGTFTTVSGSGRYIRRYNSIYIKITITITTNGTASSYTTATLPTSSSNSGGSNIIIGENTSTGVNLRGLITQGSSTVGIQTYAGAYSGADGEVLVVTGEYETS